MITVQVTGPSEKAKLVMNTTSATTVTMPAVVGPARHRGALGRDVAEGNADRGQAGAHADQTGEQQQAPPYAVDEDNGDQRGGDVHAADCPGGHRRPRRLGGEAGGGENLVGVIDDRVDAGDLLKDRQAQRDDQRAGAIRGRISRPRCRLLVLQQGRLDFG